MMHRIHKEQEEWEKKFFPEFNKKLVTRVSSQRTPWLMFATLHVGDSARTTALLEQAGVSEAERKLLYGIYYAWREDKPNALEMLTGLSDKLTGINKCWPDIVLAIMYLDLGDYNTGDKHIASARRISHKDRGKENLAQFIDLIHARSDIERGIYDRANHMLIWLAKDGSDFVKAQSRYLLGYLGRLRGLNKAQRAAELEEAITQFKALYNWYYVALSSIELAICNRTESLLISGFESVEKLNQLGRVREARLHAQRLTSLKEQLNNKAISFEGGYERIGKLLIVSKQMQDIREKLNVIASYEGPPVLIMGGPGNGKEEIAKAIHALGPRANKQMVIVNCAALQDTLFESEVFGYEKGAFTGADQQHKGLIEQAEGSTLFLDEIGELSLIAQAKLLRVLQPPGQYRRIKGKTDLFLKARIIAATNRNLDEMVAKGTFRQDLYDRLKRVWKLVIPDLNDRPDDILPLAEEFLKQYGKGAFKLSSEAICYLVNKRYAGNVRELESDIERGVGIASKFDTKIISRDMIAPDDEIYEPDTSLKTLSITGLISYDDALARFHRWLLNRTLTMHQGKKAEAAGSLKIDRTTLYRLAKRWSVEGFEANED